MKDDGNHLHAQSLIDTSVKRKGAPPEEPFSVSPVHPARRSELPTFWFVERLGFFRLFQINALDGPPSPNLAPKLAKSRRAKSQPYDGGPMHGNPARDDGLCGQRRVAIPGNVN